MPKRDITSSQGNFYVKWLAHKKALESSHLSKAADSHNSSAGDHFSPKSQRKLAKQKQEAEQRKERKTMAFLRSHKIAANKPRAVGPNNNKKKHQRGIWLNRKKIQRNNEAQTTRERRKQLVKRSRDQEKNQQKKATDSSLVTVTLLYTSGGRYPLKKVNRKGKANSVLVVDARNVYDIPQGYALLKRSYRFTYKQGATFNIGVKVDPKQLSPIVITYKNQDDAVIPDSQQTISANTLSQFGTAGTTVNLVKQQLLNYPNGYKYLNNDSKYHNQAIVKLTDNVHPNDKVIHVMGGSASMNVNYIDQNDRSIKRSLSGQVGDVVHLADRCPKGYTVGSGQCKAALFSAEPQKYSLFIKGRPVKCEANIVIERDYVSSTTMLIRFSGRVGDLITIDPNQLRPQCDLRGYYIDLKRSQYLSSENMIKARLRSPNDSQQIEWLAGKAPIIHYSAMKQHATVHFITQNNRTCKQNDVLNGYINQEINLNDNHNNKLNLPDGYRFNTSVDNTYNYRLTAAKNQSLTVHVIGKRVPMTLHFINQNGDNVENTTIHGLVDDKADVIKYLPLGYNYNKKKNRSDNVRFSGAVHDEKIYVSGKRVNYRGYVDIVCPNKRDAQASVLLRGNVGNTVSGDPGAIVKEPGYELNPARCKHLVDGRILAKLGPKLPKGSQTNDKGVQQITWGDDNKTPKLYFRPLQQRVDIEYVTVNGKQVGDEALVGDTNKKLRICDGKKTLHLRKVPKHYHIVPNPKYNVIRFEPTTTENHIKVVIRGEAVHLTVHGLVGRTVKLGADRELNAPLIKRAFIITGHVGDKFVISAHQLPVPKQGYQCISKNYHGELSAHNPILTLYFAYYAGYDLQRRQRYPLRLNNHQMLESHLSTVQSLNDLKVGSIGLYNDSLVAKTKPSLAHNYIQVQHRVNLYDDISIDNKSVCGHIYKWRHQTIPVESVVAVIGSQYNSKFYEVRWGNNNLYVDANSDNIRGAYWQKQDTLEHAQVEITRTLGVYGDAQLQHEIGVAKRGNILSIDRLLVSPQTDGLNKTVVQLSNSKYIAANKDCTVLM